MDNQYTFDCPWFNLIKFRDAIFTARCTIVQNAVLRLHVVRLLSVCNFGGSGPHRLDWKSWKLLSRTIS